MTDWYAVVPELVGLAGLLWFCFSFWFFEPWVSVFGLLVVIAADATRRDVGYDHD